MACYIHAVLASTDAAVADLPSPPEPDPTPSPSRRTILRPDLRARARNALAQSPRLLRQNLALVIVLALGTVLRIATYAGYGPAFYFSDTRGYFEYADLGIPQSIRGYGYSAFLNLFRWTGELWPVTAIQHLLGLACAVGVYALILRRGGRRWLAVLAAAPVALDGYSLVVEHYLLGDSLFTVLTLAGLLCVMWQDRLTTRFAIAGGVFLALSLLTRTVAVPVIVLAGLYVLVRRVGPKPFIALVLAVAIPMMGYLFWFHHYYGQFSMSNWQDRWFYGRMMSIANCHSLKLNPPEQKLCNRPVNDNAYKVDWYVWSADSPAAHVPRRYSYTFTAKVMLQQPDDYLGLVARETWAFFSPDFYLHRQEPTGTTCPAIWEYPLHIKDFDCAPNPVSHDTFGDHRGAAQSTWPGTVPKLLHGYQRYGGITPGPILAICLLLLVAALLAPLLARRRGLPRREGAWRLRWDALLLGGAGLGLLIMAITSSQFDIRYGVPVLVLIPPAGALAWTSLQTTLGRTASKKITTKQPPRLREGEPKSEAQRA